MTQCEERKVGAIILAAGKGKRMKSGLAKVMHPLCGKPMLAYSVDVARAVGVRKIAVVIGHQADIIRDTFRDQGLIFVEQHEQLGTGHAVLQAKNAFLKYDGTILILCGDVPLLLPSTVKSLIESHFSGKATLTVLTTLLDDPSGYGRVIKGAEGEVLRIVEEKDASPDEKKIREINTGIYCVECDFLFRAVEEIGNENVQKEYYLTDIVGIASNNGFKTRSLIAADSVEVMGVNTLDDLERASAYMLCKSK
ncbi:MAG TPA: NTP transferase domain-containing protein [Syntrophales bacterium]|nr:NTP transferase domain-containing protein [Syntrophales bacterium]